MTFRSERLRRYVATLNCPHCGTDAVQVAHRNFGKGLGLKVSDGLVAALCMYGHSRIDQGKDLVRDERRKLMDAYIVATYHQAWMRGDCDPALFDLWGRELAAVGLLSIETEAA